VKNRRIYIVLENKKYWEGDCYWGYFVGANLAYGLNAFGWYGVVATGGFNFD
jgi:hypothetical protein